MIEAVVFDMDGVLIDSEPLWRASERVVFARYGHHITDEQCRLTTGLRVEKVVAYWEREVGSPIGAPGAAAAEIMDEVVARVSREGEAMPGVYDAIALCRRLGLKVALATASDMALVDMTLKRLNLEDAFDAHTSAEHLQYSKPHPQVYMDACAAIDVACTHSVAIEDSLRGAISAKAASMRVVAVPDHEEELSRFGFCDAILRSLTALDLDVLESLAS